MEPEIADQALPPLDPKFQYAGATHLGAYGLWAFLDRWDGLFGRVPEDLLVIRELRSDAITIHDTTDGRSVVTSWRLRFASEKAAERLWSMLSDGFASDLGQLRRIWVRDRDVLMLIGDLPEGDRPGVTQDDEWGPLPESEPEMMNAASSISR